MEDLNRNRETGLKNNYGYYVDENTLLVVVVKGSTKYTTFNLYFLQRQYRTARRNNEI
jgi:hypothetical protein